METKLIQHEDNTDRNWFKKHAETITVLASLIGGFIWMDSKFEKVGDRLSAVEKDVAVIKTILSIKGLNCNEFASRESNQLDQHMKKVE